jgi:hypothetical protein
LASGACGRFCGISRVVCTIGALVGGFKGANVAFGGATRGCTVGTPGAVVRSMGTLVGFDVGVRRVGALIGALGGRGAFGALGRLLGGLMGT